MTQVAASRFVFVDECGSHLAMTPLYAWAPRGQRAVGHIPKNRGHNTTLIGALTSTGVLTCMTLEGAADGLAFAVFVQHFLVPKLVPGQIVIWDNLSIHQSHHLREWIEAAGCELWFLPTYSPDFNPIELCWSKLKQHLRRVGARTREALDAAIGAGLDAISHQDAAHWFRHCGYHIT